jgi:ABC-2 type transport system ATP-binding protein
MNTPIIVANQIHKSYGDIQAVKGVSFQIPQGEVFGLLGPNGAGKTTLISILTGLIQPSQGTVLVKGKPLARSTQEAQSRIGFVPQELALYRSLSARDNLLFFGRIYGLRGKKLRKRVDAVLEMVGLLERAGDPIETYSGGMKRRINIAAGLLHEPEILFLDEPTVGVDPQSRNAIFESVEALNQDGITIIYTTHYMEAAERLCHRVAIVDEGTLIALDSPNALIDELGGGMITLGLENGLVDEVIHRSRKIDSIKDIHRREGMLIVRARELQNALVDVLQETSQLGARVKDIRVLEPNLEAVFLQMTGKELRD